MAGSTKELPSTPPKCADTDPCTLFQPGDLDEQLSGPPSRANYHGRQT
ncbi:hypothetical protein [Lentzea roselyniae]